MKSRTVNIGFVLLLLMLSLTNIFANVSLWSYLLVLAVYLGFQVYGSVYIQSNFFIDAVCEGRPDKAVALTFDDGPIAGKTERILDILKANNVKAAFFCIGKNVNGNPDTVKRIYDEGHVVGNHSYFHGKLFDLQPSRMIEQELADTDQVIQRQIAVRPRFFRPPYGVTNPMVARAVRRRNYVTVGWTLRSFDTVAKSKEALMTKMSSIKLNGGEIVLFHDYSEPMIEMLPAFIKHVEKLGLKIVALDELITEKAYV